MCLKFQLKVGSPERFCDLTALKPGGFYKQRCIFYIFVPIDKIKKHKARVNLLLMCVQSLQRVVQQSIQIVPSFIHGHQRDGGLSEGMERRKDTQGTDVSTAAALRRYSG